MGADQNLVFSGMYLVSGGRFWGSWPGFRPGGPGVSPGILAEYGNFWASMEFYSTLEGFRKKFVIIYKSQADTLWNNTRAYAENR